MENKNKIPGIIYLFQAIHFEGMERNTKMLFCKDIYQHYVDIYHHYVDIYQHYVHLLELRNINYTYYDLRRSTMPINILVVIYLASHDNTCSNLLGVACQYL